MGLLEKFKRGGGGFLNNVTAALVGLEFTTDLPGGGAAREVKNDFQALWAKLTFRADGSDKLESTSIQVGNALDFEVDGMVLTPVEGAGIRATEPFGRLYESAVKNGLEDEGGETNALDFSHMINRRYTFVQVKDEAAQARLAKAYKKDPKKMAAKGYNAEGQKKGKDGKYYDQRTPEVSQVFDGVVEPVAAAKGSTKSTARTNGSGKAAPPPAEDHTEFAQGLVLELLDKAKDNKIAKSGLNVAVTRRFSEKDLKNDARRDEVRKIIYSDEFLEAMAAEGLISYSKSGKDQIVSAAA